MVFILFPQLCFPQSDSLADCFPLSIGNQWIYNFDHWKAIVDDASGGIVTTDTGTALYKVINKTEYADSVLWTFKVNRSLTRWSVYTEGNISDTTVYDSTIVDSSMFMITEILDGMHELYQRSGGSMNSLLGYDSGVCWNNAIPFQRNMPDSAKFYRYQAVDSTSTTSFILRNNELGIELDIAMKKDTGLTSLYVGSTMTMWFERAHHYLASLVITNVKDHRLDNIPLSEHLSQNYPNPFNPATTISYQLPTRSYVTLKVFDILGREVATLVSGVEEPGYKSVTFDGSKFGSGVYFYRLQAGNYVETKKLLLLR